MRTDHSKSLCLIILLVQQICVSRPDTFQVLGPADPVVAVAGEDTVLPCYLSPRISAEGLEIRWFRDEPTKPVFLYHNYRPELQNQMLNYKERAALFPKELSKGNTSLRLTRVRGSDHGRYRCFIMSLDFFDDTVIEVDVRAVGTQTAISLETHQAQGVSLGCESKGWFPEPEVVWLDSEGQSLTADPTETHRDSQDLFTVRRQVTVQHSATNRFTCRVQQQQLNQVREAEIDVPSELFPRVSPWMVAFWVILVLVLCALVGLAMVMYRHVKLRTERDWLCEDRDWLREDRGRLVAQRNVLTREKNALDQEKGKLTKKLESASKEKDDLTREIDRLIKEQEKCRPGEWQWLCSAAVDVTLDPDTVNPYLSLSEDGKRVREGQKKSLPDHPHRFNSRSCVVSREGFTSGRHYWEVEVNDKWTIGVSKESAERKGVFSFSPQQGYWCLGSGSSGVSVLTDPVSHLPLSLQPRRLGVCVDIEDRKVSFYTVESRAHIYTFTDMVFNQGEKIYPVFWTWDSDKDLVLLPAVSCGD